tara:strand:- start:736 stop:930 length:195 start_codon:yes stop_codon:yes gene_type:complete
LVEQVAVNHFVGGSSPSSGAQKEPLDEALFIIPNDFPNKLFQSNDLLISFYSKLFFNEKELLIT